MTTMIPWRRGTEPSVGATAAATDRVSLRVAELADAPLLYRWRRAQSVRRFQPLRDVSVAQLRADIQAHADGDLFAGRGERFQWMIERNDRAVGWITLVVGNWEHGLAELGYALAPEAQGKGTMSQALTQLMPDLLVRSPIERIEARCAVGNVASSRVLEKLGFVREGTLRQYFRLHGERVDHYLYALLRSDYIPRLE
ncbi:MAG: N-acetyltransferase [Acidobacteria bacterium]|nr:MAG: N-acetyltransferase [Acidobacteriota bacterium]REK03651.1 MAG: N-acetyltransferase [Acidobacteriota bacterium]